MRFLCQFLLLLAIYLVPLTGTPESSPNWEELVSTDGIKFSGRNGINMIHMQTKSTFD